ncbi:MAG TPA: ABC transporter substrate-binding protein [Acetobacteraceae bacterium]|nr:ABC transporter substrate-binding protein [Acetobacteraceae bacterium]
MMMRRGLLGLLLAGLVAGPVAARAAEGAAEQAVSELNDSLVRVMKAGPTAPFPRRYEILAPVIESVFDLAGILRACVGPRWASLASRDQADLLGVFRRFTIASYVANFDDYAGERFEVLPESRAAGSDQVIGTRIVDGSGSVVRIDYVMRREADAWKAVDVLLDGTISRVAVQRSDFRGLLGEGPDISGLIASLQQKVADLSRGTMSAG